MSGVTSAFNRALCSSFLRPGAYQHVLGRCTPSQFSQRTQLTLSWHNAPRCSHPRFFSDSEKQKPSASKDGKKSGDTKAEPRPGLLDLLKNEVTYIKEHVNRNNLPEVMSARQRRLVEKQRKEKEDKEVARDTKAAAGDPAKLKAQEEERIKKAKQTAAEMPDLTPNLDVSALVSVDKGQVETVWSQRIEKLKSKVLTSGVVRAFRKKQQEVRTSEHPVLEQVRETQDKLDDLRDSYETSQHPLVWKMRDVGDTVFGETETGWALGELKELDPSFDMVQFLDDMEYDMIPLIIKGFLEGDMNMMKAVTEGQAARLMFASEKERQTLGVTYDCRILNIGHLDCTAATVVEGTPHLILSFQVQQVHCVRDKKGEIKEGGESDIRNVIYQWAVRRDFENPEFDWKIVEFQFHRLHYLV